MGSSFVAYFDTDVQRRGLDYHYLSIPTLAILTVKGGPIYSKRRAQKDKDA